MQHYKLLHEKSRQVMYKVLETTIHAYKILQVFSEAYNRNSRKLVFVKPVALSKVTQDF